MILATYEKSPYKGEVVYVPDFARMEREERNKVNKRLGRRIEDKDSSLDLLIPLGLLTIFLGPIITGIAMDNRYVFLSGPLLLGLVMIIGLVVGTINNMRYPMPDGVSILSMDDVRWSVLLVAFKDHKELWDRMIKAIKIDYCWHGTAFYETPLSAPIDEAVSGFMSDSTPTIEAAQRVKSEVERIFAEHDQEEHEKSVASAAAREIEAASAKQLFDLKVQMAEQDVQHQAITANIIR